MASIKVDLAKAKETKRYVVFKNDAEDAPVNTIYVLKEAFAKDVPGSIRVEIAPH